MSRTVVITGGSPAVRFPSATVGDTANLLDVHVNEFAGPVALVAHRGGLRGSDHRTGQRIAIPQVRHPVAAQDRADRAGRRTELIGDPLLTTTSRGTQHDSGFDAGRCPTRAVVRA